MSREALAATLLGSGFLAPEFLSGVLRLVSDDNLASVVSQVVDAAVVVLQKPDADE